MMFPSLKNIQYLVALRKHLHFSKVAQECFLLVNQPSALVLINLKKGLEVQLVECNNKSVLFTPAGEKIVGQAKNVMLSTYDLVQIAQQALFNISKFLTNNRR
ncbi:hypothetical protein BHECKSOX_1449 [Bathymodiolus heckerae thiotrophic gill symbiont]|uniref:hypothetical protein n=1 Tax=Bathymodiolus heckerae thiotrophic gill symbiont TaxID=1052212 RepID=UPI0010B97FC3|nr:hypothetical protein [Bathymodiolus heckerae thiotrophic gill symbiont]SHN91208.1 hypothetical protein BHECKSOX_1449 [Bathymodiolus heckerae thiotrophic gill symbiont]